MKFVNKSFYAFALSTLLFSGACATSDSSEPVDAIEEENRLPEANEEAADIELPSPEEASAEAAMDGTESIESNTVGDVESLPSDQQLALENSAMPDPNGAGGELEPAPTSPELDSPMAIAEAPGIPKEESPAPMVVGAETEMPAAPAAETAVAESPALPMDTVSDSSIPTLADVVADTPQQPAADQPAKKSKKSKKRMARSAPTLSGSEKLYIVQPDDTLGKISRAIYGTTSMWQQLAELNGISGHIYPGDAIKYAPNEASAAFDSRIDALAKTSVTVEKGDTLSRIAQRVMGDASYWKMIWRWNESAIPDPNRIAVGQALQYVSATDLATLSASTAAPAH